MLFGGKSLKQNIKLKSLVGFPKNQEGPMVVVFGKTFSRKWRLSKVGSNSRLTGVTDCPFGMTLGVVSPEPGISQGVCHHIVKV